MPHRPRSTKTTDGQNPRGGLSPDSIRNILLVCSGNICRSPMAHGYLEKRLRDKGFSQVHVRSAGTLNMTGQRASEPAVQVGNENGFDLTGHISAGLSWNALIWADLVLVMEHEHLRFLNRSFPESKTPAILLGDFGRKNTEPEIDDPVGFGLEEYRTAFLLIRQAVDSLVDWLASGEEKP